MRLALRYSRCRASNSATPVAEYRTALFRTKRTSAGIGRLTRKVSAAVARTAVGDGVAAPIRTDGSLDPVAPAVVLVGQVGRQRVGGAIGGIGIERAVRLPDVLQPRAVGHHLEALGAAALCAARC